VVVISFEASLRTEDLLLFAGATFLGRPSSNSSNFHSKGHLLKFLSKKTENLNMLNENKSLYTADSMRTYVMHIRYRLLLYQLDGIDPPQSLLDELKTAELLARLESKAHE
jgi:hypothetical protein